MSGQEQLKNAILDKDLCSSCGMCLGLCPYLKAAEDRVRVIHPCGVERGTCFQVCPKTGPNVGDMDLAVFGKKRQDQALGVIRGIYVARARGNRNKKAQYGGVASALTALALEEEIISGAILTGGDVLHPDPRLASSAEDVMACAGSKYTAVPTLEALNQALRDGRTGLGVTGRPCQAAAVRRAQLASGPDSRYPQPDFVKLIIGIFCFWALGPELYGFIKREVKNQQVVRMDIPLAGPLLETEREKYRFSLDDIRPLIKKSCQYCFDPTAEWADISVGATEYDEEWNTLIVRTKKGQELVKIAEEKNILQVAPYPEERLPVLRKAVLNKKIRVLDLPQVEAGIQGFPVVPPAYREEIRAEWGGVNG